MKIVILDGYTLNPGDLDWSPLEQLGSVTVYERTPEHLIAQRTAGAEIIFTNKTPLRRDILHNLKDLSYIGVLATGYDVVDIDAAAEKNVTVTNVPAYGIDSVAQMVFAHILNISNNVAGHADDVKYGGWQNQKDFCYLLSPQVELADKVLGIIGYGDIGKATASLALAFKMKVLIHTRTTPQNLPKDILATDRETLLSSSDVVSLHCPLTEATKGMICKETIAIMKREAIVINCSRGPLINEADLAEALNTKRIKAAGLDVLSNEPPQNSPLIGARNCWITPHIAWATREARARLLHQAAENVRHYLNGKPVNRIN